MKCPNCKHVAGPEAFGEPAKCPECGVYYEKALAHLRRRQAAIKAKEAPDPVEQKAEVPGVFASMKEAVQEGRKQRAAEESTVAPRRAYQPPQEVVIVDFNMSFWAMVKFMVKWTLATIPAVLILALIAVGVVSFFGGLFRGLLT